VLEAEFQDGRITLGAKPTKRSPDKPSEQGSLF
jgi:hypothetical protein